MDILKCSCEFLSNLVSLTSETTSHVHLSGILKLWVPFKSCIFDIRNNKCYTYICLNFVVSSFQILYLWHQKQRCRDNRGTASSCEFLSNLVSLTSETTHRNDSAEALVLWVPFKSCIFDIRNNYLKNWVFRTIVVSSFQILYLWHQKQLIRPNYLSLLCCEFLSNLVSLTSETTRAVTTIFDIRNNPSRNNLTEKWVVSSFQILYLWHQKQPWLEVVPVGGRCEFLSNLVSLTSETTNQPINLRINSCEFLSNLVSLTSETTITTELKLSNKLWVPFKSCIFDIRNNAIFANIAKSAN